MKIACKGAVSIRFQDLNEFQGELKTLSKVNFEKLKKEIIKEGFSFTIHVWKNNGKWFILDGHQRLRTVKTMAEEGWTIPDLPCSIVEADSYKQAKRKLLGGASSYGKVTSDGLLEYLQETDITPDDLISSYEFPGMNVVNFVESNFEALTDQEIETLNESEKDSESKLFTHVCPKCQYEFKD